MKNPKSIKTDQRIYKIETFEGNLILCNLEHIKETDFPDFRKVSHIWDGEFKRISKMYLKDMIRANLK